MKTKNGSGFRKLRDIRVTDDFWKKEMELVRTEVIPYQWDALNDNVPGAAPSFWRVRMLRQRVGNRFHPFCKVRILEQKPVKTLLPVIDILRHKVKDPRGRNSVEAVTAQHAVSTWKAGIAGKAGTA